MDATAALKPTTGNTAAGTVTFTQKGDKVSMTANVSGLSPVRMDFTFTKKGIAARAME